MFTLLAKHGMNIGQIIMPSKFRYELIINTFILYGAENGGRHLCIKSNSFRKFRVTAASLPQDELRASRKQLID